MKKIIVTMLVIIIIAGVIASLYFYNTKTAAKMVKESNNPQVLIKTSLGDITLELYPDKAPITVENFLSYVNEKSYDNTVFHRVIDGFMIQGGGFTEDGKQKPAKPPIKLESDNGLKNTIGTVAMARTTVPDSATNQFFINTNDNYFLNNGFKDEGYAVFGKVTDGMDIVKNIEKVKTLQKNGMTDWPESNVIIKSIRVVE